MDLFFLVGMIIMALWMIFASFFINVRGQYQFLAKIFFKLFPLLGGLFLIFCVLYFSKAITVNF